MVHTARFVDRFMIWLREGQRSDQQIWDMCTLRRHEVAYPTSFEAVLRAECALLSKFQTCRTLQGTCIVWTVDAYALFLPSRSFYHTEG